MSKTSKSESKAAEVVLDYLKKMNRPYSVNDIQNNLQTAHGFGKTLVTRVIDQLAATQQIREKEYGKSKIYYIDQKTLPTISEEEIQEIDTQTKKLEAALADAKSSVAANQTKLKGRVVKMSKAQIQGLIGEVDMEIESMESRLADIKQRCGDVDPKESLQVKKEFEKLAGEWKKRKRMASNMFDAILENYPKPKKAFFEEVGIETDEDNDAKLPTL